MNPFPLALFLAAVTSARADFTLETLHAAIRINERGFVTSLTDRQSHKEYSPANHPSPLLSLHEHGKPNETLVAPVSAVFQPDPHQAVLQFANGSTATVAVAAKDDYFRFQLLSLTPRDAVDTVVWGPINTTISGKIGDIIGVVRDNSWAIGLWGIDDNTIPGPVIDGDCYGMGYYIHSPDPVKYPLPPEYKEGQRFNIGGNGVTDTAFYSHPEEYFQQLFGSGAKLEPAFGSSIAYHARDRTKPHHHLFSLLPGFQRSQPRHLISDPVEGTDFIGSAVALYACPDDHGLAAIEHIIIAEGLPHIKIRGKWVRDPALASPTLYFSGPQDKCIEYAKAMGFNDISHDTAEFYPSLDNKWEGKLSLANGQTVTYKQFGETAHQQGMTHGGLHTLCVFLQGGICNDVTPVPGANLQTVCRTRLAKDISATDTRIVVTAPSFLADKGTWTMGDDSNYLRVGSEMMRYESISDAAPWTITGVKRGHASKATGHHAGDELVKLMQNCYNGFVPDMNLMLDYADYYAQLMVRNEMDTINFDGYESLMYQHQGYYAMKLFNRRLFDSYATLTGGRYPRVTGSNVFSGAWEFMNACDVGGGDNMFNPCTGEWGIEGKDIRNGFANSYFPPTFGLQSWHSDWSLYDAQNLMAKAAGWDATFGLNAGQQAIEATGEREAIFAAFHAWQKARSLQCFSGAQKAALREPGLKFNLIQTGNSSFTLDHVKENHAMTATGRELEAVSLTNPGGPQLLQFGLRFNGPANGCVIILPGNSKLECAPRISAGQFILCKGDQAYLADNNRRKIAAIPLTRPVSLPHGESRLAVRIDAEAAAPPSVSLTTWVIVRSEQLGNR